MALSRIWSAFIIVAVAVAAIRCFFFGDTDIFTWMVIGKASDPANPLKMDGIIETCWVAVEICLRLIGILSLFIGFMSIAESWLPSLQNCFRSYRKITLPWAT